MLEEGVKSAVLIEGLLIVAPALSDSFTIYELSHFAEFAILFGECCLH